LDFVALAFDRATLGLDFVALAFDRATLGLDFVALVFDRATLGLDFVALAFDRATLGLDFVALAFDGRALDRAYWAAALRSMASGGEECAEVDHPSTGEVVSSPIREQATFRLGIASRPQCPPASIYRACTAPVCLRGRFANRRPRR